MKKSKMNVALLRQIQKQILKTPIQFQMWTWFVDGRSIPNCGTAACIAGWAIALNRKETLAQSYRWCWNADDTSSPFDIGRRALRITSVQASRLFFPEHWPDQFRRRDTDNAAQAVRRIEHFVKTGGQE